MQGIVKKQNVIWDVKILLVTVGGCQAYAPGHLLKDKGNYFKS